MFFEFPMGGGGGGNTRTFNLGDLLGGGSGGGFPGGFSFSTGMPGGFEMGGFPMMSPIREIEAKHGWLLELPYKSCLYDILGICRDASEKDISKAYKRLAVKWHPDNNLGKEEEASIQFDIVNKAYEFLKNPKTRELFDSNRDDILRKQEENTLSSEFNVGDKIALHSLNTVSFNGLVGYIDENFDMTRKRWPVRLEQGDVKSFKAANIRLVYRFKRGDRVELHSLSAACYNGKRGTIESFNAERGRWTVNLDDRSTKTFKPNNLHYISEYSIGDRVILQYLSTAALNDKIATIYKPFLSRRGRWPVKLGDGSCRNVKSVNLRIATEADEQKEKAAEAAADGEQKSADEGEGKGEKGKKMDTDDHTKLNSEDSKKSGKGDPDKKMEFDDLTQTKSEGNRKTEP